MSAPVRCVLCGLTTHHPLTDDDDRPYCCPACREVARLLEEPAAEAVVATGAAGARRLEAAADRDEEGGADGATGLGGRAGTAGRASADDRVAKGGGAGGGAAADLGTSADGGDMARTTLGLSGLWCPSCAWLVGAGLRRSAGVRDAEVSFVGREARVDYDPARTDPAQLAGTVRRLGYRATLPGEDPPDEEGSHLDRLLVAGVLAMHVMAVSALGYVRDFMGWSGPDTAWLERFFDVMMLGASLPVLLLLGLPVLRAGLAGLLRLRPNLHTLVALGAGAAYALSVRNVYLDQGAVYFDTATMLLVLVAVGRWLEMHARKAGADALERMLDVLPTHATWLSPDGAQEVALDALPTGARVRVTPGGRIPVDGLVAAGTGDVDESLLTGEPRPVRRAPGDPVLAGSVSLDGGLEIVTRAVGADTVAGQIGHLLGQALWRRAPVERQADRLAALLVPLATVLAGLTFAFWTVQVGPEVGLMNALAVLLIACPCALGLATPLTLWLGLSRAAEAGVPLRGAAVLERLAGVRRVFFDKTGTLTRRAFRLQGVETDGVTAEAELLARAAALEARSEHPLADAVADGARSRLPTGYPCPVRVADFRPLPGLGVTGRIDGAGVWVGGARLMAEQGLAVPPALADAADGWRARGATLVFVGWGGRVRGLLALDETPRPEAMAAVRMLTEAGVETQVLTGDDGAAGERWSRRLGVPVHAALRPADKLARLEAAGERTLMVGDGINDGPALAAASVGLAVPDGTDLAQSAADGVLLRDDLRTVPWLLELADETMRRVRVNLGWAVGYNAVGLVLAAAGLLQPVLAALAMVASSALVTTNALRLRDYPPPELPSVGAGTPTDAVPGAPFAGRTPVSAPSPTAVATAPNALAKEPR